MESDRDKRTNRHFVFFTLFAWSIVSSLLFVRLWWLWGIKVYFDVIADALCALAIGYFPALVFAGLPFRVIQNAVRPERRLAQIKETILCIFTFFAVAYVLYSLIMSYPTDW